MMLNLLLFLLPCHALYFYLEKGVQKCFLEDVPQETLVVASYESLDFAKLGNVKISSVIKNPRMAAVDTQFLEEKGRIVFTTEVRGTHNICFTVGDESQQDPNQKFKFKVFIDSGEEAQNYEELARVEHLSSIEVEVRRLNDKIRTIRQEQLFQRQEEEKFRDLSEEINENVVW